MCRRGDKLQKFNNQPNITQLIQSEGWDSDPGQISNCILFPLNLDGNQ